MRYFDACTAESSPTTATRISNLAQLPTNLPVLVPYATVYGMGDLDPEGIIERICEEVENLCWPDLIVHMDAQQFATGSQTSSSQYYYPGAFGYGVYGFGGSTTETVYENLITAMAFRVAPTRLGIAINNNHMVLVLEDTARAAGLLEGDTIVNVGGRVWGVGADAGNSPHLEVLLSGTPGDLVSVVWIRPGTGRMEGLVKLLENPRFGLDALRTVPVTGTPNDEEI